MEFNEKVWLRAAIKGIRPIIEYKINTGGRNRFQRPCYQGETESPQMVGKGEPIEIHAAQPGLPEVSLQIGHIG